MNFIAALSSIFNCQTLFDPVEIYCLVVFIWFSFTEISLSIRRISTGDSYFKLNVSTAIMLLLYFVWCRYLKINSKHGNKNILPILLCCICDVINLPNIILLLLIFIYCIFSFNRDFCQMAVVFENSVLLFIFFLFCFQYLW